LILKLLLAVSRFIAPIAADKALVPKAKAKRKRNYSWLRTKARYAKTKRC